MLTTREIELILEALKLQYGHGYSDISEVCKLQGKLSIMGEMARKRELAAAGKD